MVSINNYKKIIRMANFKQNSCRLCLKTDTKFEVIDNHIRSILDILPQLKLDERSKQIICKACSKKLKAAFEFKSMCMNTNNIIIQYAESEKKLQIDLRQLYLKENGIFHISQYQKICGLCRRFAKSEFRRIKENELEDIKKFAPKMNIDIIQDPIICKRCFYSLCTHNSFLINCLEVEKIIENLSNAGMGSNLFVKNEELQKEFEINDMEMSIKEECLEIKSEDDSFFSDELLPTCDKYESAPRGMLEPVPKHIEKYHKLKHLEEQVYKCHMCDYEGKYRTKLLQHFLEHKSSLSTVPPKAQLFKCNMCDYSGKYVTSTVVHKALKHDKKSKTKKCNTPKTTSKRKLKRSLSKPIYKCEVCDFQTMYKYSLKKHQLRHENQFEAAKYKSDKCQQLNHQIK